ncbi:MAG: hypothetical protein ACK56I_26470, partial [bacterium]
PQPAPSQHVAQLPAARVQLAPAAPQRGLAQPVDHRSALRKNTGGAFQEAERRQRREVGGIAVQTAVVNRGGHRQLLKGVSQLRAAPASSRAPRRCAPVRSGCSRPPAC